MGTRRQFIAAAMGTVPTMSQLSRLHGGAQSASAEQPEFSMNAYDLRSLPLDRLQFMLDTPVRYQVSGERDGNVVMSERRGQFYDHPVRQAMECMLATSDYVYSGLNLDVARDNLDRLFQTATMAEDAAFFPYHFDFALHGNPDDTMVAPWYSGMAQGLALGAASRLYNVTEDPILVPYIESAIESFRAFNSQSRPWSPTVDERSNLWIEEYPDDPPGRVLNGHLYAAFGLYDYWLVSRDEFAANLIRGILTTVEDRFEDFRRIGSASKYCLAHQVQSPNYHAVHIGQLLTAGDITGDKSFVEYALLLADDYPLPFMSATTILPAGEYSIYKAMPEAGGSQEEFHLELTEDTDCTISARQRQISGDAYYYRVQARNWQPYWIKEGSNELSVSGSLIADPVNTGDDMGHTRGTFLTLPNPYPVANGLSATTGCRSVDGLPDPMNELITLPEYQTAEISAQITHDLRPLTQVRLDHDLDVWIEGTAAEVADLV